MSVALKIDENLPSEAVRLLRTSGHDVRTVAEQQLAGGDDERLASICRAEGRALMTFDTDFADIRRYPPEQHAGLIVLRLARQDVDQVLHVVERLLGQFAREPLAGKLWIVDEATLRIRPGD